jgi:hypothetical protein
MDMSFHETIVPGGGDRQFDSPEIAAESPCKLADERKSGPGGLLNPREQPIRTPRPQHRPKLQREPAHCVADQAKPQKAVAMSELS